MEIGPKNMALLLAFLPGYLFSMIHTVIKLISLLAEGSLAEITRHTEQRSTPGRIRADRT